MAKKKTTKKTPAKKKAPKQRAAKGKKNTTRNTTLATTKKSARKVGRPKASAKVVTPEVLETISSMYVQGETLRTIAKAVGIDFKTVHYHLEKTIRPLWREGRVVEAAFQMAKVNELERTAWRKFRESCGPITREQLRHEVNETGVGEVLVERIVTKISREADPTWLSVVQWCVDHRAKVGGLYAAAKIQIDHGSEVRVAGKSPAEFDQETLVMLLQRIQERKEYEEAQKQLMGE